MAKVLICWPKTAKVLKQGLLVASGRMHKSITSVSGQCQLLSVTNPPPPPIVGDCSVVEPAGSPTNPRSFSRWMIAFKRLTGPGLYELSVTGMTAGGVATPTVTRQFIVSGGKLPLTGGFSIDWPSSGDDISSEADDFSPYGTIITGAIGDVSMTDQDMNVTDASYTYSDTSLEFWIAQFPTLPDGTYTLDAADSTDSNSASVDDLTIDS